MVPEVVSYVQDATPATAMASKREESMPLDNIEEVSSEKMFLQYDETQGVLYKENIVETIAHVKTDISLPLPYRY